jgi:NitT/TauT family transport system substrate-binding protein
VRIGYGSITGNNLGLWMAHDAGLFAEQGLDVVDFPLIEGGTLVIQSLIAGDVQFVLAGSSGIIAAVLRGAELQMIAGASNKFDFALIAAPGIRTGDDLRGKRVGVSRFGSSSDFAARIALDHLGLDPNRDVTMLQVGGTSARLGALQSGAIDAAPQIAPALLTAQKLGFNMLVDLATLGVPYEGGPISTTRAIATENPELARRMIRSYLAGIHRMKTDKALALEVSRRYLQTDDQAILEESWEHFALKVIPEVPYLVEAALQSVLRELATEDPQAATARPDQFYDNRFLREAEDNGFVRQLYGR